MPDPLDQRLQEASHARWGGDPDRARDIVLDLLQQAPDDARVRLAVAENLLAAGQPAAAVPEYDKVLVDQPGNVWAATRKGNALRRAGRAQEALEWVDTWLARTPPDSDAAISLQLERLAALRSLNQQDATTDLLARLLAARPEDRRVLAAAYWTAHARADHAAMLAAAEAILSRWPDDRAMQIAKGRMLRALGRVWEALAWFDALQARAPKDAEMVRERAACLRAGGDHAAADTVLRPLLNDPKEALRIRHGLVDGALARQAWAEARAHARAGLTDADGVPLAPMDPDLALGYLAAGPDPHDTALAQACLATLAARRADLMPGQLWRLVRAAEAHGSPDGARAAVGELLGRPIIDTGAARAIVARLAATGGASLVRRVGAWLAPRVPPAARLGFEVDVRRQSDSALAALRWLRDQDGGRFATDPASAIRVGDLLVETGQAALAHRYLRRVRRHWPEAMGLIDAYVRAALRAGQPQAALGVLDLLVQARPDRAGALARLRADVLYQAGQARAALAVLDDHAATGGAQDLVRRLGMAIELDDAQAIARLSQDRADVLANDPARQVRAHSALGGFQLNEWGLEARYLATCGQDSTPAGDLLAHARGVINAWLATDPAPGPAKAGTIPRQILQFWHARRLPPEVAHYMASWQSARGFTHHRFHQHDAACFLADRLGPDWVEAFRTPRDRAAACDFFRLCWLALEGGIYADADDRLVGDLPALLSRGAGTGLLLYQEPNGAVANNFIAARPGHPVIARAAVAARDALLRREYEGAWSATGPGLITRTVAAHIQACAGPEGPPDLRIIAQIDLVQSVQIHLALRYKTSANYWANSARPVLPDYSDLLLGAIAPRAATGGARRVGE